ncbi:OLC1v1003369C2 [Oldenlandia corymbosa var. corymbosa]|uniref:OLC1v1003369C2 n=1 Tax=Oldenlandia corymbosa var. corymbosa TaxID=529605 RepID=A0AAV1D9V9_OLDCO|nr:OLC1v1003369C2 [Oldenlandia corymbosa var. corymbosa]
MEITLVTLLRVAWIGGTLPILIASIPSSKLNWVHDLLSGFAKRGKTLQSSSSRFTVPQRFFGHFYVLAVIWTTTLLVATWVYAYSVTPLVSEPMQFSSITSYLTGGPQSFWLHESRSMKLEKRRGVWLYVFLLLLMEAQVLRRLYETIYVFKYSPSARMHIFGYITGLYFYAAAPLSLCCTYMDEVFHYALNLIQEFIVKGKDHMQVTETNWWGFVNPLLKLKWHAWFGAIIFLLGWIHQRRCHAILGLVREKSEGSDDYVIPYGDWFRYVSCPHYLAEIVCLLSVFVQTFCL